jgi:hypothetical protein
VAEDHHHGAIGGGCQPDGRVAATLFQGSADEEPWVSALRLDESVGKAPAGLHVHMGHVDLSKVASDKGSVTWWSSMSGGERGGGTPTMGVGEGNGFGGRRKGDICKPDGGNVTVFPASARRAGAGVGGWRRMEDARAR